MEKRRADDLPVNAVLDVMVEGEVNASGHQQELERNFGLLSTCGLALTTGNTWIALGGSIVRLSQHRS